MELLIPNWNQERPDWNQTRSMCHSIQLTPAVLDSPAFDCVLSRLRESHCGGGAFLASFQVCADSVFDWFASRNRLLEDGILRSILSRREVTESLPEIKIPPEAETGEAVSSCPANNASGFRMENPFLIDGHLAQALYSGGAYWEKHGDGRAEKQMALDFCRVAFGLRFSEILYYVNNEAWTPWFHGIAWDLTGIIFDRRLRNLWIIAITDTD